MTWAIQFIKARHVTFFLPEGRNRKDHISENLAGRTHKRWRSCAYRHCALNAGGVTIHSPVPTAFWNVCSRQVTLGCRCIWWIVLYTQHTCTKASVNRQRKQILRSIDLLVIDEVSMLRADLLDAIDYRLKAARGNFSQSFVAYKCCLSVTCNQLPPV